MKLRDVEMVLVARRAVCRGVPPSNTYQPKAQAHAEAYTVALDLLDAYGKELPWYKRLAVRWLRL